MTGVRVLLRWPLCLLYLALPPNAKAVVDADMSRWLREYTWPGKPGIGSLCRLSGHRTPEFRNLFYYRVASASLAFKAAAQVIRRFLPGERTLFLRAKYIGPGLFIQHGFATTVGAERIGSNCWINQQVTIGHVYGRGAPVIGDDVVISAGAIVVGGVRIVDRARIGANTTVVKDVPADMVAVGAGMRLLSPSDVRGSVNVDLRTRL